ncbi:MAG: UDP-N-acetylmuramoyl-L-alanyl-D-glutamate--2,6-diaminopimelate ligase [Gemmatimonadota bacterium]
MRLAEVLKGIPGAENAPAGLSVGGIAVDSRKARAGDLFVALRGESADGHDYLAAAAAAGAAAALVERDMASPPLPCVRVPSTAAALARAAANFHGDPSARLTVIGVTGTNGKTTTTYLLESIVAAAGGKAAVIGTINYRLGGEVVRAGLTTPFPHELQELMAAAVGRGATHLVMEVSSHSAAQGRIEGVRFDAGIFTNLSHDHLDFHGDMESYFDAKASFFRKYIPAGGKRAGVAVNADDAWGRRLAREFPRALAFGSSRQLPVHPRDATMSWEGSRLILETPSGPLDLRTRLIGAYNVSNVMAAVCGALLVGIPADAIRAGVERLRTIPGRMEEIPNRLGLHIYVDYAHTPDGLDRTLSALRGLARARLITVFGCGGNRDRTKRPEMGRISARRSDVVVVTSDNPRNEDPGAIIREIVPGLLAEGFAEARAAAPLLRDSAVPTPGSAVPTPGSAVPTRGSAVPTPGSAGPTASFGGPDSGFFEVIEDRRAAIARALALARPGDTIAIAGKGHENVQIIGDRRLPFDDREAVRGLLAGLGAHDA